MRVGGEGGSVIKREDPYSSNPLIIIIIRGRKEFNLV
jgi:hypothetical protein